MPYAKNGAQCQELRAHDVPITKICAPMPTRWHVRQSPSKEVTASSCIRHPEEISVMPRCVPIDMETPSDMSILKEQVLMPRGKYRG